MLHVATQVSAAHPLSCQQELVSGNAAGVWTAVRVLICGPQRVGLQVNKLTALQTIHGAPLWSRWEEIYGQPVSMSIQNNARLLFFLSCTPVHIATTLRSNIRQLWSGIGGGQRTRKQVTIQIPTTAYSRCKGGK